MNSQFNLFLLLMMSSILPASSVFGQLSFPEPTRIGIVGLVHTHVHWILGAQDNGDFEIVGIVEPNKELAREYSEQYGYSMDIVFNTIDEMVSATQPEAVTAFNTIFGHLEVVEYCAPKGIHVMVEKPLAVNLAHARRMVALANEHSIHLLTNYETSWYPSNARAFQLVNDENMIGEIRKMVFHHGHPGPIEIGCNKEFLEWLTDPVLNGGGALTDFGCYGANLATWMLKGETPLSVQCTRQSFKPDLYPNVEDEATIILNYPQKQVIIQASWNWPYNRKDMEVYGVTGFVMCDNGTDMRLQVSEKKGVVPMEADEALLFGRDNPFSYLGKVLRADIEEDEFGVSSLENNLIVMQILEAARISAETGRVVMWEEVSE